MTIRESLREAAMAYTPSNPSQAAIDRVRDVLPIPANCPNCSSPVELVNNSEIYGRSFGEWPWAYRCTACDSYVGLHPFTNLPLGTLATKAMRDARQQAKAAFNPIWQGGAMTRREAYAWLARSLGIETWRCHIGWFDVEQCNAVVKAAKGWQPPTSRGRNKSRAQGARAGR